MKYYERMKKCIKEKIEEHPIGFWFFIAAIILGCIYYALFYEFLDKQFVIETKNYLAPKNKQLSNNIELNPVNSNEVDAILYLLTAMATVALVLVAYVQLQGLFKNSRADMLLRIDKSFRNLEALKAKSIILQFTFEAEEEIPDKEEHCTELKKRNILAREEIISEKILKFIRTPTSERTDQIYLINFLNALEAACYLCNEKYISRTDITEFYQYEIPRFFRIYEKYINYKEICHENAYQEIKKLYIEIKGYDFFLMSDLPNNNPEEAKLGNIYFSMDGLSYCVRDLKGIVQKLALPEKLEVNAKNLAEKLKDKEFKSDLLKITSKEGLTLKQKLKLDLVIK